MKRFLILFLIFIFSISAVSAENADLTEDDFIPVNLYQDTYILHDYTSSNVNINISSDVSGVSNDKALVNVNVDCEDNSSFNHYRLTIQLIISRQFLMRGNSTHHMRLHP